MDVERTMEFILEQQARFAAGMEEMRTNVGEMRTNMEELRTNQVQAHLHQQDLRSLVSRVVTSVSDLTGVVGELAQAQRSTEERLDVFITRTDRELHRHDETLGALIRVVDDLVRRRPPQ